MRCRCLLVQVVQRMRAGFLSGRTKPPGYRIQELKHLKRLIIDNQDELCQAMWHDLHKVCLKLIETVLCKFGVVWLYQIRLS